MFLSMLTADAASQHGHEFSRKPTVAAGPQPPRRLPIPRSPFSRSRSPHGPSPLGPGRRQTPPVRSQSVKVTMAELREEPDEQGEEEEDTRDMDTIIRSFTIPGAFHGAFGGEESDSSGSTSPIQESTKERTPEPEPEPIIPTRTAEASLSSEASDSTSFRRQRRPKSSYRFAHPPPTIRQKKGILRPRVLLQLQERSNSGFHKPVVEVVPGSRYSARTKIGQKLQRFHKSKDGTNADDLVVLRCEGSNDTTSEEIEINDSREVLGTIQPGEDGPSAFITLDNSVWEAKLDGRGSYSLEFANDPTQKVKWYIPKAKKNANIVSGSTVDREFCFTTILPDSRKHPIVANMTQDGISICNEFSSPVSPDEVITTDDALRKLIIVSGAWVFFCEGWSKHYDFNSTGQSRPIHNRTCSMPSTTLGIKSILRSASTSPAPSVGGEENFATPAEGRSRKASHSSEVLSVAPDADIVPTTEQTSEPSSQRSSDTTPATQSPRSHGQTSSDSAPPIELPPAMDTEEKARKRRSWHHHGHCPEVRHDVRDWHHRLGSLSRKVSTKAKNNTRRLSTHLPLRHHSLPEPELVDYQEEEEAPRKEVRFSHLRRMSHHIRHAKDHEKSETLFKAEVLHVDRMEISDDEALYQQQRLMVANHPNQPFMLTSEQALNLEYSRSEAAENEPSISEPEGTGHVEPGDVITLITNPNYIKPPTITTTTTSSLTRSPSSESLRDNLANQPKQGWCTRKPPPRAIESPAAILNENESPTLSANIEVLQPEETKLKLNTVITETSTNSSSLTPSRSTSSDSLRDMSHHSHHTWWQQYDRFLHNSFEQEIDQELAAPRRASTQPDKLFALVPSSGTTSSEEPPALTMSASPASERVVGHGDMTRDDVSEGIMVSRLSVLSSKEEEDLKKERRGSSWRGWGLIGKW